MLCLWSSLARKAETRLHFSFACGLIRKTLQLCGDVGQSSWCGGSLAVGTQAARAGAQALLRACCADFAP